jgi:hypothetical protein
MSVVDAEIEQTKKDLGLLSAITVKIVEQHDAERSGRSGTARDHTEAEKVLLRRLRDRLQL